MRIVVQRVNSATVLVDGKVAGSIKKGLFVLIGVKEGDTEANADYLTKKLVKLRVMGDEDDKMNLSVLDVEAEVLAVSQFTLYANTSKGNRPSFVKAAKPEMALSLYNYFVDRLVDLGVKVQTGRFGSYMNIDAELDGPVTIIVDKEL